MCVCVVSVSFMQGGCAMAFPPSLSSALMNRWSCGVREIDGPQLHLVSSNCKILVTLDSGPWLMELIWRVDSDAHTYFLLFSFFLSPSLGYQGPPKSLPERIEWFHLKRTNRLPPVEKVKEENTGKTEERGGEGEELGEGDKKRGESLWTGVNNSSTGRGFKKLWCRSDLTGFKLPGR